MPPSSCGFLLEVLKVDPPSGFAKPPWLVQLFLLTSDRVDGPNKVLELVVYHQNGPVPQE